MRPFAALCVIIAGGFACGGETDPSSDPSWDGGPDASAAGQGGQSGGAGQGGADRAGTGPGGSSGAAGAAGSNAGGRGGAAGNAAGSSGAGGNAAGSSGAGGNAADSSGAGGSAAGSSGAGGSAAGAGGSGAAAGTEGGAGNGGAGAGGQGGIGGNDSDASAGAGGSGGAVDRDVSKDATGVDSPDTCPPIPWDGGVERCSSINTSWRPPAEPCGALCGNNSADSCADSCRAEVCDGSDLAGQTCESVGYRGGTLRCTRHCRWDASDCIRCSDPGGEVLSCINAPIDAFAAWTLALDATDQEIGLAWTSLDSQNEVRLHFARFAPDLSLIDQREPLLDLDCPGKLALAARPGGWSIAVDSSQGMHLVALDAAGQTTSDVAFTDKVGVQPMLAKREGGDPLLLWRPPVAIGVPSKIKTAVVGSNGATLGPESTIAFPDEAYDMFPNGWGTAVAAGAGWLVAVRAGHSAHDTIYIASLSASGAQVGPLQTPVFTETQSPSLAVSGAQVRMSFSSFAVTDPGLYVVPLTTSGASAGPATRIDTSDDFGSDALLAINGNDMLMLTLTTPPVGYGRLDLLHVAGGDAAVHPVRTIATDTILSKTIARRGSDVIAAWINGSPWGSIFNAKVGPMGIGMARIAP